MGQLDSTCTAPTTGTLHTPGAVHTFATGYRRDTVGMYTAS
jgi:hypothetical protein